jgi:TfoX/Sxy family transcriptional regulator of competence genes
MASKQQSADYILDQLNHLPVRVRRMFGEFALYCDDKVVGLICNDNLYLKITVVGRDLIGEQAVEAEAYPGSKPYFLLDGDALENRSWLEQLIWATAESLPRPLPKVAKKKIS